MARIAGVNVPDRKHVVVALTYVYGIGSFNAKMICSKAGVALDMNVSDIPEEDLNKIRDIVKEGYIVEGELRRDVSSSIKRLMDMGSYRGMRHRRGLPVRGQKTKNNAKTRKKRKGSTIR